MIISTRQSLDVYFPTIISTSSGSGNELFFAQSPDIEAVTQFFIFDRWGERIYGFDESVPPTDPNVAWGGKFNDELVVEGVYVYLVEVKYFFVDEPEVFKGTITVIH